MRRVSVAALALGASAFGLGLVLPRLLMKVDRRAPRVQPGPMPSHPSVDIIVPAYLESSVVGSTIEHLHATTAGYAGRLRVVVMASDSETAQAARVAGAEVVIQGERRGKAAAINAAVARSDAEVLVLTDANCRIGPSEWLQVSLAGLREYSAVSANKRETGGAEGLFWALENWLKGGAEGRVETLSLVGEFICLRRADFRPIPDRVILDDYAIARSLAKEGKSAVVLGEVFTEEEPAAAREQWERRRRIAEGVWAEMVPDAPWLASFPVGRRHLAHKIYRMTVGFAGFWLAVAGAATLALPFSLVILPAVALPVLTYSGRWKTLPPGSATSAIGMQAVPVAGLLAYFRKRIRRASTVGWEKVAR